MDFIISTVGLFGVFAMMAISVNHVIGNAGVFFLGHIAFFAIGAYCVAIGPGVLHLSPVASIFLGIGICITIAALTGWVFIKLSGHFLLIASLGICEIVRSIVNNASWAGGAQGITVSHYLFNASFRYENEGLIIGCLGLELLFYYRLAISPRGRLFAGLRENPMLLEAMGYRPEKLRIEVLIFSAFWVSLAGSLFAYHSLYIDPSTFTVEQSLLLFIAILIGGPGSIKGSFFAAFILIVVPIMIRFVQLPNAVVSAAHQIIFAVCVLFILKHNPNGLFEKKI